MNLLVLGGTNFVGRTLVEAAMDSGHEVSIFHRGVTNPGLFPDVEEILGDRDGGLAVLNGRRWDAVVDVSGYLPRLVHASAVQLREQVSQYVFISTGSVYDFERTQPFSDENGVLQVLEDETTEEYMGPAYGGLKVLCERAVRETYPESALILRLGVVAGPHDPSDRVTYWVARVARGGEVFVPGGPDRRIQFIDVRDLAAFILLGIEKGLSGIFNTPGNPIYWSHFLDACWQAADRPALQLTYVDDYAFIKGDSPEDQNPLWRFPMALPPKLAHAWTFTSERALSEGMVYRSTMNTVRDILAWERNRPAGHPWKTGPTSQEEEKLLDAWRERQR